MKSPTRYAIEFRDDSLIFYAGMHQNALGFAPTLETALLFESVEVAQRHVINGYRGLADMAQVIEVAG